MTYSMKTRVSVLFVVLMFLGLSASGQVSNPVREARVKLIYSSDIYFPPDDPDDWFDLATLFGRPEIDVLGIILDQQLYDKRPQSEGTGAVPLRQMFEISGHTVPYAIGLRTALKSVGDKGLDQDSVCQKGAIMILDLLRKANERVVLLTVGTARDIAAAYNRDPGLFRRKVSRIYLNAGVFGFPPGRFDVNLLKDRNALVAIMKSGLPVYWAPCFGEDNYETYWQVDQRTLLESATKKLRKYFLYAFSKGTGIIGPATGMGVADPVEFLNPPEETTELRKVYGTPRNMWSTVSILDAAGLKIFRNKQGEYIASRRPAGEFTQEVRPYSFKRMNVFMDDKGNVHPKNPGNTDVFVLHKDDAEEYQGSLAATLARIFSGF
jgi:hypothetical protein